jgi:hypothetical protein
MFPLGGLSASVAVLQPLSPGSDTLPSHGTCTLYLQLSNGMTRYAFDLSDGSLNAGVYQDSYMFVAGEPYDPVAHRYLRIREREGNIQWHISSDGCSWAQMAQVAVPGNDVAMVILGCGVYAPPRSAPGEALLDDLTVRTR